MNDIIIGLSSGVVFLGLLIWILTWVKSKADKNDVNSCLAVLKEDMEKDLKLKANREYVDSELRHGEMQFEAITKNQTVQADLIKALCVQQEGLSKKLDSIYNIMQKRHDA